MDNMEDRIFKYIVGIVFLCSLLSCEEKLDNYDTETCWLRFNLSQLADTLQSRSFVYLGDDAETDTVWIDVKTIGSMKDYDRKITFTQVMTDTTNAEAGKHYIAFDDLALANAYVIPANQIKARVPVIFKRDVSLKNMDVLLEFVIGSNDDFQPGFVKPDRIQVWLTDRLARPSNWNMFLDYYIGSYDRGLHECLIHITGEKWDYDYLYDVLGFIIPEDSWTYTNDNYEDAYFQYLIGVWQQLLEEDNARRIVEGKGPWMREDGKEVRIGETE